MMTDDLMRGSVIAAGDFILDLGTKTVTGPAGCARLTRKQCELLELLMGVPGQLVSRSTIMQQVWQTDYMGDTRTLDVHVSWLRRNIEPRPRRPTYLVTRRGEGYVFYADGQGGTSRFTG
jgi:DNA-binding response OmpR family regulator